MQIGWLKKRLENDPKLCDDYKVFMRELVAESCIKPGKIRLVFECSAKFVGLSLNSMFYKGPDLTNSLVEVLTRFREDRVAVMADIESMFY